MSFKQDFLPFFSSDLLKLQLQIACGTGVPWGVQFSCPATKLSRQSQHHHSAPALQQRCLLGRDQSTSPSGLKINSQQKPGVPADAIHLSLPWLSVIVAVWQTWGHWWKTLIINLFLDPRAVIFFSVTFLADCVYKPPARKDSDGVRSY